MPLPVKQRVGAPRAVERLTKGYNDRGQVRPPRLKLPTGENPLIRKYQAEDCEEVIGVWFAASQVATPFLSEEFLADEREQIRKHHLPRAETWVFEHEDSVAGFIALMGNEVGAIFVKPELQGRGIGRALMDHAAASRDSLFLDVFKRNSIGRRFYDRYGFRFRREHLHEPTGNLQLRLVYTPKGSVPGQRSP